LELDLLDAEADGDDEGADGALDIFDSLFEDVFGAKDDVFQEPRAVIFASCGAAICQFRVWCPDTCVIDIVRVLEEREKK
jgi:hypothetical protein